jgi:hypothetical protein
MPSLSASEPGVVNLAAVQAELPEYGTWAGDSRNLVLYVALCAASNRAGIPDIVISALRPCCNRLPVTPTRACARSPRHHQSPAAERNVPRSGTAIDRRATAPRAHDCPASRYCPKARSFTCWLPSLNKTEARNYE